jgi:hypothetical protein
MGIYIGKEHKLNKWHDWNKEILSAADDFEEEYGYKPNYLAANEHTLSQINFIVSYSDQRSGLEFDDPDIEEVMLLGIKTKDNTIEFCYNEELKEKEYELFFTDEDFDCDDEDDKDGIEDPLNTSPVKAVLVN